MITEVKQPISGPGMVTSRGQDTHLTPLTGADPIVVPRWFVLADEARLVDSRGRKWRRRTWDQFLGAGALSFNGYNGDRGGGRKSGLSVCFFVISHIWPLSQTQPQTSTSVISGIAGRALSGHGTLQFAHKSLMNLSSKMHPMCWKEVKW